MSEYLLVLAVFLFFAISIVFVVGHIMGEDLLRDRFRESMIDNMALSDADIIFSNNKNISNIIVCLTTTPTRIPYINLTLKSLLTQIIRPKEIRLHIPDYSIREKTGYMIPDEISCLNGINIVKTKDYGPATKLLPALTCYDRCQSIMTVDDDRIYSKNLIQVADRLIKKYPDVAFGFSGWVVPEDLTDRPTTLWRDLLSLPPVPLKTSRLFGKKRVDILQGYSGVVYQPRFFDYSDVLDHSVAPSSAFYVDDVWLSAHCNAHKYVFPSNVKNFQPWGHRRLYFHSSLGLSNRGNGDNNKRSNTITIRYFSDRWFRSKPD